MNILELAVATLLALGGIRAMASWMNTDFDAASLSDRLLYVLHATSKVGMWFAFSGFFLGYALVDEPQAIRWYVLVPIALAGIQLLTGLFLSREPTSER
jgi:hypothetical protein